LENATYESVSKHRGMPLPFLVTFADGHSLLKPTYALALSYSRIIDVRHRHISYDT